MLTAQGKWLDTARRRPIRTEWAFASSATLHAAAIALLLLRLGGRELPPAMPPIEVEMVQQAAQTRGAPPPPQTAVPPEPQAAAAVPPAAPSPTPPLPQAADLPLPSTPAPPSAPAPQAPRSAPPRQPDTEVNLGNAARDLDPLTVTGENVVPPAPDSRYRNVPPRYPPAAARIGAEGTVQLVIHVAPNGMPLSVAIASSSGNADLDAEARRAVSLWHFRPARTGALAVPYDYVLNIRFALDSR